MRRSIWLALVPLMFLGIGCFPSDYYREPHYRHHRGARDVDSHRSTGYRRRVRPRAPRRALRSYHRYVKTCRYRARVCRKRIVRTQRSIRSLRRRLHYSQDHYSFERGRARLYYQYHKLRRYKRCVSLYRYRARWARQSFYRQFGVDPDRLRRRRQRLRRRRLRRRRRIARAPRRRWAQPPPGDHRARVAPQPRVTPVVPRPAVPTPNVIKPKLDARPAPVAPKPEPRVVEPKPEPRVQPTPQPPALVNTPQIQRWRQFCANERKSRPVQGKLQYLNRKTLQQGKHQLNSMTYSHSDSATIRPLYSLNQRFVLLGSAARYSQAHCDDRTFFVWDTQTHRAIRLRPPTTAFLLRNTHLMPWFQGKKHAAVEERLLFYNPSQSIAGVLLKAAFPGMKGRSRSMYLVWDINSNQILRAWTLGSPGCHSSYRPVGVTSDGNTFYYLQNDRRVLGRCGPVGRSMANGQRYHQKIMALNTATGVRKMIARVATSKKRFDAFLPDKHFRRIALVEYTEMKTQRGKAVLVDLASGKVRRYPAPTTPYGVSFTPDQKHLLVYSSKAGTLVKIHLASGTQKRQRAHRLGHAMGISKDGQHVLLIYHGGVDVRDLKTLKRVTYLSHRKVMGNVKFIHVDGSSVGGGVLFVKNGDKLFVQKLQVTAKAPAKRRAKKAKPSRAIRPQLRTPPALRKRPTPRQDPPARPGLKYISY